MSTQVDLALWEVTPGVLGGVRKRLRITSRSRSKTLQLELGDFSGKRLVIARPLHDAQLTPGSRLASLRATHRPAELVGVGVSVGEECGIEILPDRNAAAEHHAAWPRELFGVAEQQGLTIRVMLAVAPARLISLLTSRAPTARKLGQYFGALLHPGGKKSASLASQRERFLGDVADAVLSLADDDG